MNKDIGKKIKELRNNKKMTLKNLSELTGLSTGFLSQLERGLTSIATDSLANVAEALEVDLSYFIKPQRKRSHIVRSYEKELFRVENRFIQYLLSSDVQDKAMMPRIIELLPINSEENINQYPHEGEEFVYVLEGTLTLLINDHQYELFPGDSAHYSSRLAHNWANYTNKLTRLLVVSTPNLLKENNQGAEVADDKSNDL
ncbi:DNA-binding protein [Desulforamulus ferrireducens]|uniref:DNA-binding protein n=2 Tax=Desulforamulus ferrireducens TaxID=1833852 RepID=A0A1S6IWE3_9FIRM|nr:XRE family transcriptional regulator [Desulforamulus ferrireducens]AQS59085.1 DNA-binding protein [Desulforamulus ferrireducens]